MNNLNWNNIFKINVNFSILITNCWCENSLKNDQENKS